MHQLPTAILPGLALSLLASGAAAQSPIYGVDHQADVAFRTDAADFTGSFVPLAGVPRLRALDFDADADQLWAIDQDTDDFGTIDLTSGAFFPLGTLLVSIVYEVTGLAAHPDGTTWYMSQYTATGDLSALLTWTPGATLPIFVGFISTGRIIDISVDSQGNLYGLNVSNDALYSIDPTTGAGTLVGAIGYPIDFAQGMDFDWRDDTLYATLHSAPGTAVFGTIDVTTGLATPIVGTTSVGGNMEMAVRSPLLAPVGFCYGDGAGTLCPCGNPGALDAGCANSATADGARLEARGTYSATELRITGGVPNQSVLFFEGTSQINGGDGIVFGDGLRCAGGSVTRLNVQAMDPNGVAVLAGTVQQFGGGGTPGQIRAYQGWYRDPVSSPCGSGFNLSNGVRIDY